jgi:hypothetical protein
MNEEERITEGEIDGAEITEVYTKFENIVIRDKYLNAYYLNKDTLLGLLKDKILIFGIERTRIHVYNFKAKKKVKT